MKCASESIKMKDVGLDWIGKIPESWEMKRGKTILELLERPIKEDDDIITCFRDGEVTLRKNRREDGFTIALNEIGYQGIEPGDLVVHGMDGFAGAIGISDSRGKATPVLNVMDSKENKRYIMYYLRMLAFRDVFLSLSTGIRVRSCDLRWNKLAVLPFIVPTRLEQDAIVSYLDEQCGKIDCIIAETRESIEEYKKLKISIVHEAVTKGLEQNVEMKPSGYDDIGTIPVKWRIGTVKNQFEVVCGATPSEHEKNWNGEIIWITPSDMPAFGGISSGKRNLSSVGYDSCGTTLVPAGSIILSTRAPIGKICVANSSLCTNQGCKALIPKSETNTRFYAYYFFSILERLQQDGTGTTFKELSTFKLKNEPLLILPREEQIAIAEYLDAKCKAIDDLLRKKEQIIIELELYKKSLIFETVTGKRKVV